jgi:RNA polymerase sigma-70 factor (ECF subfamily)
LPLKYRTVVVLRFFEGKSIEEIAIITGKAEGTIKSQLHRGLERLQTVLERSGVRTAPNGAA